MNKRIVSLALAIMLLVSLLPAAAYAAQPGEQVELQDVSFSNITWNFNKDTGVLTIEGTGVLGRGDDEYDEKVNYPWKELEIKRLVIGEGITEIGYLAFKDQKSLESLSLPSTLKRIYDAAFKNCTALTSVDIPASVVYIGSEVFQKCSSLQEVTFHEGLDSISSNAFSETALKNVFIPASVEGISPSAFACETLQSIQVDENNEYYFVDEQGVLYYTGYVCVLTFCPPSVSGALYIKEGTLLIDFNALDMASRVTDIYIPRTTSIEQEDWEDIYVYTTFEGCTSLQNIWIQGDVFYTEEPGYITKNGVVLNSEYIMEWMLDEVDDPSDALVPLGSRLVYVPSGRTGYFEIPSSVTHILPDALYNSNISAIKLPSGLEQLPEYDGLGIMPKLTHLMFTGDKPAGEDNDLHDVIVYYPGWLESWKDPKLGSGKNVTYVPYTQDNIPLLPGEPETPFLDVPNDTWYTEPVVWAVEQGVTEGMGDGSFGSTLDCNRAQIVTFLWRAMGCPKPTISESDFTDVPNNTWYTDAVLWAVENGITHGLGNGTFGVNNACTRAQVATFLWRAMGCPEPSISECPFSDVDLDTWYGDPVLWAAGEGIAQGMGDGTFGTDLVCTRAQVVTFLYRAFAQ